MGMRKGASLEDLRRLYEDCYGDFLRVATAITGSLEAGRDAVHDAFVGVVRARDEFRGEAPLVSWVWRSVVNSALKERQLSHRDSLTSADGVRIATADGPSRVDVLAARAAITALPERQRVVTFLRYYADLDYETIASTLAISPGTVGATLHAAHAAIRQNLEEASVHEAC